MGVVDRLRRITGEGKEKMETDRHAEITDLRRRIETIMARRPADQPQFGSLPSSPPLHDRIAGEEVVTRAGKFFLTTQKDHCSQLHGTCALGDLNRLNMEAAALLANNPAIGRCLISEGLFLDTETTGLAGGTGTLAFMIGLGYLQDGVFVTRQIFMRDFSEERAALHYLTDILETKKFLVSFNGKAFDVNLLTSRYILNRLANPLDGLPHLDLLFPSRRLCGYRLENARLTTLERELFGLYRKDDIPGSEIPARYFFWLRRRDPQLVTDIFHHNHQDVLTLAALTIRLAELVDSAPAGARKADPRDLLAAARLLKERNNERQAADLLRTLTDCNHPSTRLESQRMLSLIWKRKGEWEKAVCLWEGMLHEDPADLFAAVELAKWYEHRCHNYEAAQSLVAQVLARESLIGKDTRAALEHRLGRLQSRLSRVPGGTGLR